MRGKRLLKHMFGLMVAMLPLAGCGETLPIPTATSNFISPATTPESTTTPTPIPLTPTIEPAAMLTPTFSATQPSPTPAEMPKGPGVEWHLVVVSESTGWGLGAAYASQIEKDVGVKVTLDDFAIGDLSAGDVLGALQTGTSSNRRLEALPAALMNADIVVLFPSPMNSIHDDTFLSMQRCFGNIVGTPDPCSSNGFDEYIADLEAIWDMVFELRGGKPTILRALDFANPFVSRWNENQIFDACTVCWECISAATQQAAGAYHIPFLSRYDAFDGANHDKDLGSQGYLGGDGIHPNGLAQQYTAELLSGLGYEPVTPP